MILLIDNHDSFTYNLVDYLIQLGQSVEVKTNDLSPNELELSKYNGVVISPGPETPSQSGFLFDYLKMLDQAVIPTLGICLGHQAIGEYFGLTLAKSCHPAHGKASTIRQHEKSKIFESLPKEFEVVRYNSLILEASADCTDLKIMAIDKNKEIMAIEHTSKPFTGLQFHPESILTEYGMDLLKNWIDFYSLK